MIRIIKNNTNNVVLTLSEKMTVSPNDILFQFINDTSGETVIFSAVDVSPATDRYNLFFIHEGVTVSLILPGYWSYTIYEMPEASPPDLNPLNAITVLETGKVLVIDNVIIQDSVFDVNDQKNNIIFE